MSLILKSCHKRITAFSLCLACLLTLVFPLTTYAAVDSVSVTLRMDQTFSNSSAFTSVNSVFHYEILSLEAGNPMPSGSSGSLYSFTIDGTTSFDLGPITFTDTGVYRYEIRVDSSFSAPGYTYDKQVYSVRINIRKSGQNLIADITIGNSSGSKSSGIKFNHSYTSSGSKPGTMADPPVQKTVSGNPSKASTFAFLLTAGKPSNPMPVDSVNGKKTITINGSGQKRFGTWEYIQEGTYYYTISEVNTGETGYTYDSARYTITDVVKDVNGQLTVKRTVTNEYNKLVESFIFINKYNGNSSGGNSSGGNNSGNNNSGSNNSGGNNSGGNNSSNNNSGNNNSGSNNSGGNNSSNNNSGSNNFGGNNSGNNNPGSNDLDNNDLGNNGGGSTNGPKTGDDAGNDLYTMAIMIASIVAMSCILYLVFVGSRRKEDTEKY